MRNYTLLHSQAVERTAKTVTVDSSLLLGARQGGETPSHTDANTSTSLSGLQLEAGPTFLPMHDTYQFLTLRLLKKTGLFNSIGTAFRHGMIRRPFGLQTASVEPSVTGLARTHSHCQFDVNLSVSLFSYPTLGRTGKRWIWVHTQFRTVETSRYYRILFNNIRHLYECSWSRSFLYQHCFAEKWNHSFSEKRMLKGNILIYRLASIPMTHNKYIWLLTVADDQSTVRGTIILKFSSWKTSTGGWKLQTILSIFAMYMFWFDCLKKHYTQITFRVQCSLAESNRAKWARHVPRIWSREGRRSPEGPREARGPKLGVPMLCSGRGHGTF